MKDRSREGSQSVRGVQGDKQHTKVVDGLEQLKESDG